MFRAHFYLIDLRAARKRYSTTSSNTDIRFFGAHFGWLAVARRTEVSRKSKAVQFSLLDIDSLLSFTC